MTDRGKRTTNDAGLYHPFEETTRPDTPELEGGIPLPEELTGRASGTRDHLTALFDNETAAHLADGFRGGSGDEPLPVSQADSATVEEDDGA
jgi:hypothetical protein